MTEIPEHLLKRAQAAREKAAAEGEAAPAAAAGAAASPSAIVRAPALQCCRMAISASWKWR